MSLIDRFTKLRRLLKALDRIAVAQESQARSLQRLADHFAPEAPAETPAKDLKVLTGVSYARDIELATIEVFKERMWRDQRRTPTDEEISDWLDGIAPGHEPKAEDRVSALHQIVERTLRDG